MKLPRINCKHFDWGAGGKCNKLNKFLSIFRRSCPEVFNQTPKNCKIYEPFQKPDPPVPPPCREYKCYGSLMVQTKESIQKGYEWSCRIKG